MGRKAGNKGINLEHENRNAWAMMLWPHFSQKGLKEFSMNEVANVLGKSKATVYKYFKTREDILELILSEVLSDLVLFEEALKDKEIDYVSRYIKAIEILSLTLGGISTRFLIDLKKYHPVIWESIEDFKSFTISVLGEFYKEGKKKKLLGDTSVKLLITGDEIFLSSIIEPEFLHKNNLSLEEGLSAYFQNKMFGMLKR